MTPHPPRWGFVATKGVLLLLVGCLSITLLLLELRTVRGVLLVGLAVWSFSRLYYLAFYVIEKYVDPSYRFSGLMSFVCYVIRRK